MMMMMMMLTTTMMAIGKFSKNPENVSQITSMQDKLGLYI